MKKRFLIMIALVCCLVLAAGILAACNSNEGTQTGGQTPGGSTPGIGDNDEVYRTVTFDLNGGDGSLAPRKYVVGELMVLPAPTRDGYRFIGWQDASGRVYDDSTAMPDKNLTLYAQWEAMAGIISVEGGTIDGEEIFMLVESQVDIVSLAFRVKCAEGMIWRLYHDSLGQQEIPTKIAAGRDGKLDDGDNVFYIIVTSTDATQVSVYSLTIHRSYAASISFYDGDELLYTDTAYTGREYVVDYVPDMPGRVFHYWETTDGNECSSFMHWGSVSLYANRTANVYKATLNDDYDDSVDGKIINITYGEAFTFPILQRVGYSFLGWYIGDEQLTSSDGRSLDVWEYTSDQTVTARWQINSYAVALQTNISGAGEWSGTGNYEYASKVNIKAAPYLGYEFTGWYDGDRLVSEQSSYTFSLPAKDVTYTAKFVVKDEMSNYSFTSTFDECTITGIKDKTVTEIILPDYATSIYSSAFSDCKNITSATMPTFAIDYIPQNSLQTVVLTSGEFIGDSAFYGCSGLTSITIGNSVTSIGDDAFSGCSGLTSVTIPDSVTSMGRHAFSGCSSLTSVTIGNSVTSIGDMAFSGCSSLTSVTIGNSVTSIEQYAFRNCSSLTAVTIPDSVIRIGYQAFISCTELTSITIGSGVTDIGQSAFWDCHKLIEVYNKSSLNVVAGSSNYGRVGYYAKRVYKEDVGSWLTDIEDGFRFFYDGEQGYLMGYYGSATEITLPASFMAYNGTLVENYAIYKYAFYDCSGLTSVIIPDSVTSIGTSAFSGCSGLTSVIIPDSVTSIGESAFINCHKLIEVYNKSSLNIVAGSSTYGYVGYYAKNVYTEEGGSWFTDTADGFRFFYDGEQGYLMGYYGAETAIDLPASFTAYDGALVESYAIYKYAFEGCSSLTFVTIPDSVTSIGERAFSGCSSLTFVTIPDSVTSIGERAFSGCSGLTSVTIGNSVTSIGKYAFDGCPAEIIWGDDPKITEIGNYAFSGYEGTSITIPNSVTSIGDSAFYGCSGLTSVTIPDSVMSIVAFAFWGCYSLEYNQYDNALYLGNESNPYLVLVGVINNGVTSCEINKSTRIIYSSAFSSCSALTSVTIPDSVMSIGDFAFAYCSNLTSITIPDSVTSIGSSAFEDCQGLTSVIIPDSVTSIGRRAFYRCSSMTSVTFEVTTGWYYTSSSTATSGISLSSSGLSDPSTAAAWLWSTYSSSYWKRNV